MKTKLIIFLKTTTYAIATILSICLVFMVAVISTAQASEPTALELEQARIQWIAEHGEYQQNLTEPAKQEALVFTATKQKELDDERKKSL